MNFGPLTVEQQHIFGEKQKGRNSDGQALGWSRNSDGSGAGIRMEQLAG